MPIPLHDICRFDTLAPAALVGGKLAGYQLSQRDEPLIVIIGDARATARSNTPRATTSVNACL